MQHAARCHDDARIGSQIFALCVPGQAAVAQLEHVNAGTQALHSPCHQAIGRITAIVDPGNSRNRRH